MKRLIANALWGALSVFSVRLHDWAFSPKRHAAIRFKHREIWWAYAQKGVHNERHRKRALAWQIQFRFKTPPIEALARGDLK